MGYVIAKYIRLSIEDAKTESLSIENQHRQLDSFIKGLPIKTVTVLEFVDNGYSGTNLERPQLQRLLSMVREGKIDCIVIKDFSRLARNVIDAGYFVEQVFPLYQVRLVALGDKYDSDESPDGTASTMGTTFQFIVNEFYSLELSKKIRASKAHRREKGLFVSKNCVFGYKLNTDRKMVIDEPAADTVRLIFNMALHGETITEIVRRLYVEQRPTASAYKGHRRGGSKGGALDCIWDRAAVYSILHNEQYTGMYVMGKSTPLEVGSKKRINIDESHWVKIPDHHPAIVSAADFQAVQHLFDGARKQGGRGKGHKKGNTAAVPTSPLKGKVYCGGCGRKLRYMFSQNPVFRCGHTKDAPDAPCHRMVIGEKELTDSVFAAVRQRLQIAASSPSLPESEGGTKSNAPLSYTDGMRHLYEQLMAGEIDAATYKELAAGIARENDRRKKVATASGSIAVSGPSLDTGNLVQIVEKAPTLTNEIADGLINRVRVYPGGRVEVDWKLPLPEGERNSREEMSYVG